MSERWMVDEDMKRVSIEAFLDTATECAPILTEEVVAPKHIVTIDNEDGKVQTSIINDGDKTNEYPMGKGESLCLDFGNHYVGYVTIRLSSVGSPQDAPAYVRLKFGEVAKEITENSDEYDGWISRGWIQEEFIHIDTLPVEITLPRRYAFRYLEFYTIATSRKWKLVVDAVSVKAVSAVKASDADVWNTEDKMLADIDRVGLRTLQNCMQSVFEDGPKRDRRLWLGDLRLQALANYETFQRNDLVKRCLYLFAGMTREDGKVSACTFIEPEYLADDTFFFDYSLFFVATLYDYYKATKEEDTLKKLWSCAKKQIELSKTEFDENGVYTPSDILCFIDWKEGLDKQAAGQAVYIYCAKRGLELAKTLGDEEAVSWLTKEIEEKTKAALDAFWNETQNLFVSGPEKQISYASQAWMVLAEVVDKETGAKALLKVLEENPDMNMVTPYMNHHFVEALFLCGEKEKAIDYMKYYWGGMVEQGADTFWELYNPENPEESPYGSSMVNSYCHAWSCTPSYLFRKYMA